MKSERTLFALMACVFTAYSPLLGAQQEIQQISDALKRYDAKDGKIEVKVKETLTAYAKLEEGLKKIGRLSEKTRNDILWEVGGTFFDCDCKPALEQNREKKEPYTEKYLYGLVLKHCGTHFGRLDGFSKNGTSTEKAVVEALGFIASWNRVQQNSTGDPESYFAANKALEMLNIYRRDPNLATVRTRIDQQLKAILSADKSLREVFEKNTKSDSHQGNK